MVRFSKSALNVAVLPSAEGVMSAATLSLEDRFREMPIWMSVSVQRVGYVEPAGVPKTVLVSMSEAWKRMVFCTAGEVLTSFWHAVSARNAAAKAKINDFFIRQRILIGPFFFGGIVDVAA